MTTREAFADLISKRKWYMKAGLTESAGNSLASRFRNNNDIRVSKLEEVLGASGYKVKQEKLWEM